MRFLNTNCLFAFAMLLLAVVLGFGVMGEVVHAKEPAPGAAQKIQLGGEVDLEIVYIPKGEFKMGSTNAEKEWAVSEAGGARFSSGGGYREAYEGKPRLMRVKNGFWMGRTEVTVRQFRKFADETGFVTDAEKPGGSAHCFNPEWKPRLGMGGRRIPGLPCLIKAGAIPIMVSKSKITSPSSL
ncbi:SUMF1/EgtB/PvdO family nonheme iron enzyme [uncultured Gimesia sp.]|uniref:SUMF1/EgtB/PvdO family nonheme iron enzyme n=1 Tax=uncultured Gimesia sp. TaxID=1678688 RepID=UPI00260DE5AE|nr:SUMF1/EgtB/PvdO family nonheme iron enzyme [uncultured Gimesia sp.]